MADYDVDVCVVGAGIAGASVAYELAAQASVLLVERESHPGYHATGRSAALYTENYGNKEVRTLAIASRPFLQNPPEGFAETPILSPRGMLLIGNADQKPLLDHALRQALPLAPGIRAIDPDEALGLCPVLRSDYIAGGVWEREAYDIDVHALHWGFLKGFRQRKGHMLSACGIEAISRTGQVWQLTSGKASVRAKSIVNAAGAWADQIAELAGVTPLGLAPKRRTAATVDAPAAANIAAWPCVIDVAEEFYFKPTSGAVLVSPADETPVAPCDAQPEDLDIAVGIDRVQRAANLPVHRLRSSWAGLRTFAPDKTPVLGPDPMAQSFCWLAGQGGYGIMTAPAMASALAGLLLRGAIPEALENAGLAARSLRPDRFR